MSTRQKLKFLHIIQSILRVNGHETCRSTFVKSLTLTRIPKNVHTNITNKYEMKKRGMHESTPDNVFLVQYVTGKNDLPLTLLV